MKSSTMIKPDQMKLQLRLAAPRAKKRRSKLPRRRRSRFSQLLCKTQSSIDSGSSKNIASVLVNSSCSSRFVGKASCDSSVFYSSNSTSKPLKKRVHDDTGGSEAAAEDGDQFHRVTINNSRESDNGKAKGVRNIQTAALESCAESSSGAEVKCFEGRTGEVSAAGNRSQTVRDADLIQDSDANSRCEISCVEQFCTVNDAAPRELLGELLESGLELEKDENSTRNEETEGGLSFTSQLAFPSEQKFRSACSSISKLTSDHRETGERNNREVKLFEVSQNRAASTSDDDTDFLCTEQLSHGDFSGYTSSQPTTYSDQFPEKTEAEFSDYSPSMWLESLDSSGSDFSEKSLNISTSSPTFSLFLQYGEQFFGLDSPLPSETSWCDEPKWRTELTSSRFQNDADEESYQRLRNRERRQALRSYTEHDLHAAAFSNLVLQQRLHMVHWIVEQSITKNLHSETMFLGVNLLDRFLSKGFFKSKKFIQIVGIACLVLATRLEENQPLNTVREKTFSVGSNEYRRCEVVGMEWLVQKVLNFHCVFPTIHNFLWFYLKAARANVEVEKIACYLAMLVLLDHKQLCYWTSTVAAGLVILACLAANQAKSCQWVMETHVRTKDDDLSECIKGLEWLFKYVH